MKRFLCVAIAAALWAGWTSFASVTSQVDKSPSPLTVTVFGTPISTPFAFQATSDFEILDMGQSTAVRDPAAVLTLGSDYTAAGGGYNSQNQMQTGSFTLTSTNGSSGPGTGANAVLLGDQLIVVRSVPINQTSSFVSTGPNTVILLEQALDKLATLSQQLNEIAGRSLQFENFEYLSPLLTLASRKGMLLGFDATTGAIKFYNPAGLIPSQFSVITAAQSMAAMRLLSPAGWVTGQVVMLQQYYAQHDGGGGLFFWDPIDTTADNGGTIIQLTALSVGRLHRLAAGVGTQYGSQLPNAPLNVQWFGAIADHSVDAAPGITAAYKAFLFSGSSQNGGIYVPAGNYSVQTPIVLYSGLGPDPATGSINIYGDGSDATIFYNDIASSNNAMFDLGNTPFVNIRGINIEAGAGSNQTNYFYLHTIAELTMNDVRGGGLTGTFISVNSISAWSRISQINSANTFGTQLLINGSGGVVSDFNLGTTGLPALEVINCNALDIHDGQFSGSGPYKSFTGAAVASGGSTFTITENGHGFLAGDYIYVSAATSHSAYVGKWKITSVTANTIVITSAINPGSDTLSFGSLWSVGYFGGAGTSGLDTESSFEHIIWNTAGSAPDGSTSLLLDGCSGGSIQGCQFNVMRCDYGSTSIFAHGFASAAYDGVNSYLYAVVTSNAHSFTAVTATGTTTAGAFVSTHVYCIETVGSTDFTAIGASANAVGVIFTATGAGTGTGTAANVVNHSMQAGGYAHFTGGTYAGYWLIQGTTSNTITVMTTGNLGSAVTQPLEADVLGSSVSGVTIIQADAEANRTNFGAIRIEGASNINFTAPQIINGGSFSTSQFNSVVVSDGGFATPIVDIDFTGGSVTDVRQTAFGPTVPKVGFVIDGTQVYGLKITGCQMTGGITPFQFINSATPTTCNLDTDYFKGWTCIVQQGASGTSVASGSATALTWGVVTYDPHGMFSLATPTLINIPTGARLAQLTVKTTWNSALTGTTTTFIDKSPSTPISAIQAPSAPGSGYMTLSTGPVAVFPADTFVAGVEQTSGSPNTVVQQGSLSEFSIQIIQ